MEECIERLPLFTCKEWQCGTQDYEMIAVRYGIICRLLLLNEECEKRKSIFHRTCHGFASSLSRSVVRCAHGGLLRSPSQSLATLLRLPILYLELMTTSKDRQRLRRDLINNDLKPHSFLQAAERSGPIIGIHWRRKSGDDNEMSPSELPSCGNVVQRFESVS